MSPLQREARLLVEASHLLAEGPLWFENRWWWVDIEGGTIQGCNAAGGDFQGHNFGQPVPAFAPWGKDHFLIALRRTLVRWHRQSGEATEIARLDDNLELPENRFNDGKWDPFGRFVVGTLNPNGVRGTAHLYSMDPVRAPGALKLLLSDVDLSNGLAWTPDGRTLYHVDSLKHTVTAHDYDPETGGLSNSRMVIQVPEDMGIPDGMDIDPEGNLWVAHWNGSAVRRWSPKTGQCLEEIPLPCSRPTSCCLGGADDLLITTARTGLTEGQIAKEPLAGSIFVADLAKPRVP